MMSEDIFSSLVEPVPPVRQEIELIRVESDGREFIYLHDEMGYATPHMALEGQFAGILSLFDGKRSVYDIVRDFGGAETDADAADGGLAGGVDATGTGDGNGSSGGSADLDHESMASRLLDVVRFLDENGLLQSRYFRVRRREVEEAFETADIRKPVCAGTSYPDDAGSIRVMFDKAFAGIAEKDGAIISQPTAVRAVYAPHIDIRVGLETYARAFSPLKALKPKRVVILATSHYSGLYYPHYDNLPFIISTKDFETPLGTLSCDREFCRRLASAGEEAGVTLRDRAHRLEHSIELHLLFLQYLWSHDFQIVPVLVSQLEELMFLEGGHQDGQVGRFVERLRPMIDDDTLVLISGDQAHVGRKFGDREPASELFEEVRAFDDRFLALAADMDAAGLLSCIKSVTDRYRICGFSPLYTWLRTASISSSNGIVDGSVNESSSGDDKDSTNANAETSGRTINSASVSDKDLNNSSGSGESGGNVGGNANSFGKVISMKGKVTAYDLWDERERESAVSFAGMVFTEGS